MTPPDSTYSTLRRTDPKITGLADTNASEMRSNAKPQGQQAPSVSISSNNIIRNPRQQDGRYDEAKAFLALLDTANFKFADLVKEGLNPLILKQYYLDLGLSVPKSEDLAQFLQAYSHSRHTSKSENSILESTAEIFPPISGDAGGYKESPKLVKGSRVSPAASRENQVASTATVKTGEKAISRTEYLARLKAVTKKPKGIKSTSNADKEQGGISEELGVQTNPIPIEPSIPETSAEKLKDNGAELSASPVVPNGQSIADKSTDGQTPAGMKQPTKSEIIRQKIAERMAARAAAAAKPAENKQAQVATSPASGAFSQTSVHRPLPSTYVEPHKPSTVVNDAGTAEYTRHKSGGIGNGPELMQQHTLPQGETPVFSRTPADSPENTPGIHSALRRAGDSGSLHPSSVADSDFYDESSTEAKLSEDPLPETRSVKSTTQNLSGRLPLPGGYEQNRSIGTTALPTNTMNKSYWSPNHASYRDQVAPPRPKRPFGQPRNSNISENLIIVDSDIESEEDEHESDDGVITVHGEGATTQMPYSRGISHLYTSNSSTPIRTPSNFEKEERLRKLHEQLQKAKARLKAREEQAKSSNEQKDSHTATALKVSANNGGAEVDSHSRVSSSVSVDAKVPSFLPPAEHVRDLSQKAPDRAKRRLEIQEELRKREEIASRNAAKMKDLLKQIEALEQENHKLADKDYLIRELDSLGVETEGMPYEELQAKHEELVIQREIEAPTTATIPDATECPVERADLQPSTSQLPLSGSPMEQPSVTIDAHKEVVENPPTNPPMDDDDDFYDPDDVGSGQAIGQSNTIRPTLQDSGEDAYDFSDEEEGELHDDTQHMEIDPEFAGTDDAHGNLTTDKVADQIIGFNNINVSFDGHREGEYEPSLQLQDAEENSQDEGEYEPSLEVPDAEELEDDFYEPTELAANTEVNSHDNYMHSMEIAQSEDNNDDMSDSLHNTPQSAGVFDTLASTSYSDKEPTRKTTQQVQVDMVAHHVDATEAELRERRPSDKLSFISQPSETDSNSNAVAENTRLSVQMRSPVTGQDDYLLVGFLLACSSRWSSLRCRIQLRLHSPKSLSHISRPT
jgi:hypothetical protein